MSYGTSSPYYTTPVINNLYLGVMVNRPIPAQPDDKRWQINATYNLRPDLLAYDLYSDSKLWWVFAQRNPNVLADPLFDFVEGTYIYLPTQATLSATLGV